MFERNRTVNSTALRRRQRLQEWRSKEYPNFDPWHFNTTVEEGAPAGGDVLEIGAGFRCGGCKTQMLLKSQVRRYAGGDIDPRVMDNPHLYDALPFEDNSFDLVFHTMVAEHLPDPTANVRVSLRVLKPGELLMFHSVSFWSCASLVAAATPHWFHMFFVRHLGMGMIRKHVFPTHYCINTVSAIHCIARTWSRRTG